jgi:acetyl-CoA C-acetyltransferase
MALDPRAPVIIGTGQTLQRAATLADARSPIELMADSVRSAAADAKLSDVPAIDSIRIVQFYSWRYENPAYFLAEALGQRPADLAGTTGGGNTPQSMVNLASLEIQAGKLDLAVLAGGETWRTRAKARKEHHEFDWPKTAEGVDPPRVIGSELTMSHPVEVERGITMPVQVYPMFETALRAAAGESVEEHQVKISELWSRFSSVAASNAYAWSQRALSAEEIRTPGPNNRMIGFPYPKYMNSNNDVDMTAAVIICSVERARSLGVPEDRWVFPHSGADSHEHYNVSERITFTDTPAIRIGGQQTLELAGLGIDDIEVVDLYSCFPSAVQLGAQSLGLSLDRQLTRTGGLSFAGGPWNNYVMHAIATVVADLRERPGAHGFVWANGGYATKHAFGVYSTTPPAAGFRHADPQAEIDAMPKRAVDGEATGEAAIEAYSVMHTREGTPETALAACLLPSGARTWATANDPEVAAAMCDGEWVGRPVHVAAGTLQI